MKPTPQFNDSKTRRDSVDTHKGASFPMTDFAFKANSFGDFSGRCRGDKFPSFRGISADYFMNEARKNFVSEAAVFILISATVAVPVFQAVRGLVQYVYGVL
jgi:hypothetical protein